MIIIFFFFSGGTLLAGPPRQQQQKNKKKNEEMNWKKRGRNFAVPPEPPQLDIDIGQTMSKTGRPQSEEALRVKGGGGAGLM